MTATVRFLLGNAPLLAVGFFFAFASSFGHTFFIALFGAPLRQELALSHGEFGAIFTISTLGSAVALIWLGKLADRMSVRSLGVISLCSLAATCLAMAAVTSPLMLMGVIFGLRLFGQGMLSHISATSMARWFQSFRGRALSIAAIGFPAGTAVLPLVVVALTEAFGWRAAWIAGAGLLVILGVPFVWLLLRAEPAAVEGRASGAGTSASKRQWTRGEVLRDPIFYLLLPAILAPSFITTAVFFHQAHLVEAKGWSLAWFAATYPAHAIAAVTGSLLGGWAVDRWSAARLVGPSLLPLAGSMLVLGVADVPSAALGFMVLSGLATGAARPVVTALWAELYGTRHLGAIRALEVSGMVLASSLGPGVTGWALDIGVDFDAQLLAMGLYSLVSAAIPMFLVRKLRAMTSA